MILQVPRHLKGGFRTEEKRILQHKEARDGQKEAMKGVKGVL